MTPVHTNTIVLYKVVHWTKILVSSQDVNINAKVTNIKASVESELFNSIG